MKWKSKSCAAGLNTLRNEKAKSVVLAEQKVTTQSISGMQSSKKQRQLCYKHIQVHLMYSTVPSASAWGKKEKKKVLLYACKKRVHTTKL